MSFIFRAINNDENAHNTRKYIKYPNCSTRYNLVDYIGLAIKRLRILSLSPNDKICNRLIANPILRYFNCPRKNTNLHLRRTYA